MKSVTHKASDFTLNRKLLRTAFLDTVPVMTGYVFLGFGFGILMQQNGFGVLWAAAMSLFIYAGSMQYVAIPLLTSGASLLTAAATAFVVNARHLFYGISMVDAYRDTGKWKPYLIFGLTDETFSINCSTDVPGGVDRGWFYFFVTLLNQLYWVSAATLGGLLGSLITFDTMGLDFVMTAMFVVIFLEQWLKEKQHLSSLIGVGASVLCLIIFGKDSFLVPAMCVILCLLTLCRKPIEKAGDAL